MTATAILRAEAIIAETAPRCAAAMRVRAKLASKSTARAMVEAHDRDVFAAWLYRGSPERAWRIYSRVFRRRAYRTAQIVARMDERIAA